MLHVVSIIRVNWRTHKYLAIGPLHKDTNKSNTCQTHQYYYVSIIILKKKSLNSSGVHALGNFEGLLIKNWHEPIIFYNVSKNVEQETDRLKNIKQPI